MLKKTGFSVTEIYTYNEKERDPAKRDINWVAAFAKKNS
jgi:hypothetical protein